MNDGARRVYEENRLTCPICEAHDLDIRNPRLNLILLTCTGCGWRQEFELDPHPTGDWVLLGRMGEAKREDAGTTAYVEIESFSEDAKEWVVVRSESDERTHELVDRLAGEVVRVTIEIIGGGSLRP